MRIHKLSATFGKLRQQTLELKNGLNIIEAPNESGKSTWAGFLRAMLYGIDTKARDKKGVIAEKNLYQPWDGGSMEGSMDLSWNEKEITLRRASKANSPLSQFQAIYTGTEEPVPGLTGDNIGELLTGVSREAFDRSAFVGQSSIAVTGSADLERRISAIVSSGQEDVSYSETEQRLRDWKNRRQSNQRNGLIPRLEEEKTQVSSVLTRLERANQQISDARIRIQELELEQADLELQASAHRALAELHARERYDDAKAELDAAQVALNSAQQERQRRGTLPSEEILRGMQGDLAYLNTLDINIKQARAECEATVIPSMHIPHPVFGGMDPASVHARAQSDAAVLEPLSTGQRTRMRIWGCILMAAGVGQILLAFFPHILPSYLRGILLVVYGTVLCVWGITQLIRIRKRSAAIARIQAAYGIKSSEELFTQAEEYIQQWNAADQLRTSAAVRAVTLERLEAEREDLAERLLEITHTFAPEVHDLFGVSAAISLGLNLSEKERSALQRLESAEKVYQAVTVQGIPKNVTVPTSEPTLSEQEVHTRLNSIRFELSRWNEALAMAQGEMNTLGDSAALDARLGELETQLTRRREEYNAILTAMDGLNEANAMLQARMSPALNARAGELFHQLTGGKYDQVSLTREFEALASRHGDITPRKLLTLSKGTADQLYLAVRLAVCDLVLSGDDPAPLVLDDALVNFDDERLKLALDLLQKLAEHRQILLFTCQSRERLCLGNASDVHVTRLQS